MYNHVRLIQRVSFIKKMLFSQFIENFIFILYTKILMFFINTFNFYCQVSTLNDNVTY